MKKILMNPKGLWILLATLAVGLVGCKDDDPPVPASPKIDIVYEGATATNLSIIFKEDGTVVDGKAASFKVESTRDWTVSKVPTDATWLTVTPDKGPTGSTTVTLSAAVNTGEQKSVTLTFKTTDSSPAETKVIVKQNGDIPVVEDATPIVDFRTEYVPKIKAVGGTNPKLALTQAYTFAGSVIANESNNTPKGSVIVQDATTPGSGVIFRLPNPYSGTIPSVGDYIKVTVNAGKTADLYYDILQINVTSMEILGTKAAEVTTVDYADIVSYESQLIKVEGIQSVSDTEGAKWVEGSKTTSTPFVDKESNSLLVYAAAAASFGGETVPTKSGYIIGYAAQYQGTPQIAPRTLADISLTENRFTPELPDGTPITITELRAKYTNADVVIDEDLTLTATVINDAVVGKNNVSPKSIILSDGTAGITAFMPANPSPAGYYAAGDEVKVYLNGVTLKEHEGLLQIDPAQAKMVKTGNTNTITPKTITAADLLTDNYQSMLVSVQAVQFFSEYDGKNFSDYGTVNDKPAMVKVENAAGDNFTVYVSGYSNFLSTAIPTLSGTITGIATKAGTPEEVRLMPRTAADLSAMNQPRFSEASRFEVPKTDVPVAAAGGETPAVEVEGNVAWTASVTEGAAYLVSDPSPINGNGEGEFTLNFLPNTDTENTKVVKVTVSTTATVTPNSYEVVFTQSTASTGEEKTATFDIPTMGMANAEEWGTRTADDITIVAGAGGNQNSPKYYNTGTSLRTYMNNTLTFTGGEIIKIEMTQGGTRSDGFTASTGTITGLTWTGSATSVVLTTNPAIANSQQHVSKIVVTYK